MKCFSRITPFILVAVLWLLSGFSVFAESGKTLMMATTTSTENTGLLDVVKPAFEKATGIELRWTPTGTGKALKLGESCDVDVLFVHAPNAEKKYVADGYGIDRREVMYNDFVIIGPENDPASIKGKSIKDALQQVISRKGVFVSRGDNSGTHMLELGLWNAANLSVPENETGYVQTGQGMMATINVAEEKTGYTLTDRGTYIRYEANRKGNPALKILVEGEKELLNQYSVIAVNPEKCPKSNYDAAVEFIKWITGAEGQKLIGDFQVMGKPLFTPNAKP